MLSSLLLSLLFSSIFSLLLLPSYQRCYVRNPPIQIVEGTNPFLSGVQSSLRLGRRESLLATVTLTLTPYHYLAVTILFLCWPR